MDKEYIRRFSGKIIKERFELGEGQKREKVTIFEAENIKTHETVIVKLFNKGVDEKAAREAEIHSRLEHENIIRFIDSGSRWFRDGLFSFSKRNYIIMQYANRGTLWDKSLGVKGIEAIQNLKYITQASKGLQYMHENSLLHLDVTLVNILLNEEGGEIRTKMTDFDISRHEGSTSIYDFAGTPKYMSPEQISNKPERASDLYSLAIGLYRLITGYFPFDGGSLEKRGKWDELLRQHKAEAPPPFIVTLGDSMHSSLDPIEEVVNDGLRKDPFERRKVCGDIGTWGENVRLAAVKSEEIYKKNRKINLS